MSSIRKYPCYYNNRLFNAPPKPIFTETLTQDTTFVKERGISNIQIIAIGAGGSSNNVMDYGDVPAGSGGRGCIVTTFFNIDPNAQFNIDIVVGKNIKGGTYGGHCSIVRNDAQNILVVAGGGGGAGAETNSGGNSLQIGGSGGQGTITQENTIVGPAPTGGNQDLNGSGGIGGQPSPPPAISETPGQNGISWSQSLIDGTPGGDPNGGGGTGYGSGGSSGTRYSWDNDGSGAGGSTSTGLNTTYTTPTSNAGTPDNDGQVIIIYS